MNVIIEAKIFILHSGEFQVELFLIEKTGGGNKSEFQILSSLKTIDNCFSRYESLAKFCH
jgi:hypothetical protein